MRLLVVCASALLLATCASAFMQGVTFPSKYEVSATFSLPYADIQEPIYTWYDADNTRQRIDYYGGVNSNLYRGDLNISYSITPTGVNRTTCFYQDGQPQLTSLFPDLTAFTQQAEHVTVNGVKCVVFQYIKQEQDKINTYNFYVSETDNTPVRYHMMGYDTVFSSHYDEYVLDYLMLKQGVDDSAFAVPQNTSECIPSGTSPGPSMFESMNFALHAQPHTELAHLHPTSALHQETVAAARQHVVKMFHAFRQQYKWQYAEAKEVDRRATVFGHNLRFVNSHNRAGLTYRVALNHLAATTSAERARRLNPMRRPRSMVAPGGVHTSRAAARDAPTYFNWVDKGAVSPVKDQGDCGSCWTFGSSQSIEGALFLKTGQLVRLSSQALVDCSWDEGNAGCGGGLDFQAYNWIMKVGGIPAEADYPYIMINGRCTFDKGSVGATAISSYVNVTQFDEDALMDALITKGPISVSIDASRPGFSFYSSGVFYDPQCRSDIDGMDHSVLLTGFGTDATAYKSGLPTNVGDYWIVKNSWSTYWGDQGYVHMSRANNNCGVATEPTYVVIADTKH